MNSQIKFLVTIALLVVIFWKIQDKFHLLDVKIIDNSTVQNKNESTDNNSTDDEVKLNNYVEIHNSKGDVITIDVDVADNELKRNMGLSNRKYLGTYEGMLFIFDERVSTPFWMKEMLIPLDILFIDADGFIVDIKDNNAPCTDSYCPSISSSTMYKYALEVNANFCQTNNVIIGNSIVMHLDSSI